jgi:hypothetical protein
MFVQERRTRRFVLLIQIILFETLMIVAKEILPTQML